MLSIEPVDRSSRTPTSWPAASSGVRQMRADEAGAAGDECAHVKGRSSSRRPKAAGSSAGRRRAHPRRAARPRSKTPNDTPVLGPAPRGAGRVAQLGHAPAQAVPTRSARRHPPSTARGPASDERTPPSCTTRRAARPRGRGRQSPVGHAHHHAGIDERREVVRQAHHERGHADHHRLDGRGRVRGDHGARDRGEQRARSLDGGRRRARAAHRRRPARRARRSPPDGT